eukprot:752282-Hanusia_phi.AAC.3
MRLIVMYKLCWSCAGVVSALEWDVRQIRAIKITTAPTAPTAPTAHTAHTQHDHHGAHSMFAAHLTMSWFRSRERRAAAASLVGSTRMFHKDRKRIQTSCAQRGFLWGAVQDQENARGKARQGKARQGKARQDLNLQMSLLRTTRDLQPNSGRSPQPLDQLYR